MLADARRTGLVAKVEIDTFSQADSFPETKILRNAICLMRVEQDIPVVWGGDWCVHSSSVTSWEGEWQFIGSRCKSSRLRKAYVAAEVAGIPRESMAQSGKGAPKRSEGGLELVLVLVLGLHTWRFAGVAWPENLTLSFPSEHPSLVHNFERFGTHADLPSKWIIQCAQQINQQAQQGREHYRHPEVHALASHIEEPGHCDIEKGSRQHGGP